MYILAIYTMTYHIVNRVADDLEANGPAQAVTCFDCFVAHFSSESLFNLVEAM